MHKQKNKIVLCVAPHPDDETLGCGGSLLRHSSEGDELHWLIMTTIEGSEGFGGERVASRDAEIREVAKRFNFREVHEAGFPTAQLDTIGKSSLVASVSAIVQRLKPDVVYLPYRNDVHSDHAAVFDSVIASTKNFRAPSIKQIYAYETLSETEFGLRPDDPGFRPNLLVDISEYLEEKIHIMKLYKGETGAFPFPRSAECIRAQAMLRGSQAGCAAAESFMILREIK